MGDIIYLEVRNIHPLHSRVQWLRTAGTEPLEDEHLVHLWSLDPITQLCRRPGRSEAFFRRLPRIGADETQRNIILQGARVLAHTPLGVRHRPDELYERVPGRVVQLDREGRHRLLVAIARIDVRGCCCDCLFIVLVGDDDF